MPDQINSGFEFLAGFMIMFNVWRTYKDKQVRGISLIPLIYMVIWGYWNCYFYPSVDAMWSFWGGLCCALMNTIWLCQILYYYRRKTNESRNDKMFSSKGS